MISWHGATVIVAGTYQRTLTAFRALLPCLLLSGRVFACDADCLLLLDAWYRFGGVVGVMVVQLRQRVASRGCAKTPNHLAWPPFYEVSGATSCYEQVITSIPRFKFRRRMPAINKAVELAKDYV